MQCRDYTDKQTNKHIILLLVLLPDKKNVNSLRPEVFDRAERGDDLLIGRPVMPLVVLVIPERPHAVQRVLHILISRVHRRSTARHVLIIHIQLIQPCHNLQSNNIVHQGFTDHLLPKFVLHHIFRRNPQHHLQLQLSPNPWNSIFTVSPNLTRPLHQFVLGSASPQPAGRRRAASTIPAARKCR